MFFYREMVTMALLFLFTCAVRFSFKNRYSHFFLALSLFKALFLMSKTLIYGHSVNFPWLVYIAIIVGHT